MSLSFDNFTRVYRYARREIKQGHNPVGNMAKVMQASRYLHKNCSRREVNMAAAMAVEIERLVQPDHVHPEDSKAARRCIGSNGKYPMPIRGWEYDG